MGIVDQLRHYAKQLKLELAALYLACRDPRVPWYAKVIAVCVIAYALSPIDLIPDPIPVLGYLDDLLLLPLGIVLAIRLIPPDIMAKCRQQAQTAPPNLRQNWFAAALVVLLWILLAYLAIQMVFG